MQNKIKSVFELFQVEGTFKSEQKYGSGHINDTYLIQTIEKDAPDYILQKINKNIFKNIPKLLNNIALVTNHINKKASNKSSNNTLKLINSKQNKYYVIDSEEEYWSAYNFIPDSFTYDLVLNEKQAMEGGIAFGQFLSQLSDFPADKLFITIPEFHNINNRIKH